MSTLPHGAAFRLENVDSRTSRPSSYQRVIDEICGLSWSDLTEDNLIDVAWAYYYFSIQFRENLEIACTLYPDDRRLELLKKEECSTSNLSPWPGVTVVDEAVNHDEFMRRLLQLAPIDDGRRHRLQQLGQSYLARIREIDRPKRALSIASYEDGGLERVFRAMLHARHWDAPLVQAFRHFLSEHIRFDKDPEQGHGALSRHLVVNDEILPLWAAFKRILVEAVPKLKISGPN